MLLVFNRLTAGLSEVRFGILLGFETHSKTSSQTKAEYLDVSSSLWSVYKFKEGFGGEIVDSLGCLDLPVKQAHAAAWYKFEPVYYRLYYKLKNNVFY